MHDYQTYEDYSQERAQRRAGAGTITGLLFLGAGIGAALACLFTPNRGSELRDAIRRGYRKTVDDVTQRTRDLREHGSNLVGMDRPSDLEKHYGQG